MEANQLDLFAGSTISTSASRPESLSMDADALLQWKTKVAAHQQRAKDAQIAQGALFEVTKAHVDPNKIDPFSLSLHPMSFYRLPTDSLGAACIYFVVDSAAQIILYIGETSKSNWTSLPDGARTGTRSDLPVAAATGNYSNSA